MEQDCRCTSKRGRTSRSIQMELVFFRSIPLVPRLLSRTCQDRSHVPSSCENELASSRLTRVSALVSSRLADSDGSVNIRNKTVTITSEPNVRLIKDLLTSLNANPREYWYRGSCGISITVAIANTLWIFSPFVDTHRGKLLRKLANARVFPRKWPTWLDLKVKRMILQGRNPSSIRNAVLEEDNVYVKLKSIKYRVHSKIEEKPAARFEHAT